MNEPQSHGRLERAVRLCLLIGLATSALLLIAGFLLLFRTHPASAPPPRLEAALFRRAIDGDAVAVLGAGLFVLMLTPVCRVLVLAVGWLIARETRFACVAMIVLALMVLSMMLGTV